MGEAQTHAPKKSINLLRGWPNPSLLPTSHILKASQTALTTPSISNPGLLYGPDPGYQPLREEISKWLTDFYISALPPSLGSGSVAPLSPDPNRICITGGASQNLACVLQVFSDPVKTRVWMVSPCYFMGFRIFEDCGLRCGAVGEGKDGIDLEELERLILDAEREDTRLKAIKIPRPSAKIYQHIIYLVPTFSNPSGKTMLFDARQKLVKLARKYDALIITDDVYDFLQWPTETTVKSSPPASSSFIQRAPIARLVDIDRTLEPVPSDDSFGNAISNGSFSKIAGPGVRTGWSEGTPKFTYGLSQCGSSRSGGAPSQLVATMMCEMLRAGTLQSHIAEVLIPAYQRRSAVMISAIREHLLPLGVKLGEVSFGEKKVFGGYFIWLELPRHLDSRKVAQKAKEEQNLILAAGHIFEVESDRRIKFDHEFRLSFSWEEEGDMVEGVMRLANVLRSISQDGDSEELVEGGSREKWELKQDLGEFQ